MEAPAWVFHPVLLMLLFTFTNLVNFADRGALGGTLEEIKKDYNINSLQLGIVAGAFVLSFTVFCPLFTHLSHRFRATRIMAIGLLVWSAAAVCTGVSFDFYSITAARSVIGIGEAAFAGLAPALIDDVASKSSRGWWLALFYSAMPTGAALGYILAGQITVWWSWRGVFLFEALLMMPFALYSFCVPARPAFWYAERMAQKSGTRVSGDITSNSIRRAASSRGDGGGSESSNGSGRSQRYQRMHFLDAGEPGSNQASTSSFFESPERPPPPPPRENSGRHASFEKSGMLNGDLEYLDVRSLEDSSSLTPPSAEEGESGPQFDATPSFCHSLGVLLKNPVYVLMVLGYSANTFVVGALTLWSVPYIQKELQLSIDMANTGFGCVTVVSGLLGTWFGGFLIDQHNAATNEAKCAFAIKVSVGFGLVGIPIGLGVFLTDNYWIFFTLLALSELSLFTTIAPSNVVLLSIVPPNQRAFAMGVCTFAMHGLGDFPSPIIVGALVDYLGNIKDSMLILCSGSVVTVIFWLAAGIVHSRTNKHLLKSHNYVVESTFSQ